MTRSFRRFPTPLIPACPAGAPPATNPASWIVRINMLVKKSKVFKPLFPGFFATAWMMFSVLGVLTLAVQGSKEVKAEWHSPTEAEIEFLKRLAAEDADFAKAKLRILPQLAPKIIFQPDQLKEYVWSDFFHGLIIHYAVEHPGVHMPDGMYGGGRTLSSYVKVSDLERWHITERELFQTAMDNVNDPKRHQQYEVVDLINGGRVFVVEADDGFAAARLLSIGLLGVWAHQKAPEDLILAIPTKDLLLAARRPDTEGIEYLKQKAMEAFSTLERPLTPELLVFHASDGTIGIFSESRNDPRAYRFLANGPVHGGPVTGQSQQ